MNSRVAVRCSRVLLEIIIIVLMSTEQMACQAKQEDTSQTPSQPTKALQDVGSIELSQESPILAQLQMDRVMRRPIRVTLKAQAGKVLANENRLAHLSPRVPGRIVAVYANLGDQVKQGDRLLLLDSPAFGEAQLEYRKAKTTVGVTEKALERAKALIDRGAIGAGEHQRREAEFENARADLHEAEEKLHLLGMTEKEIQRLGAKTLPHAEVAQVSLRAPFTGDVTERNATVGEVVDQNKTLFTVADLSTVWVQGDFPEQQASRLKVGLSIELRVRAYSEEVFTGRVLYVGAMVDPATRTVMVRSEVKNPDRKLRPEMFADITLLSEEQAMLTVPRTAIQQAGDHTVAFIVRGQRRYERRNVTIGDAAGDYVEITGGLVEGEEVVTEGSYSLKSEFLREQMPTGGPL
jgi:cobalt-zinc-cadmium efflux system membrane fusion protein